MLFTKHGVRAPTPPPPMEERERSSADLPLRVPVEGSEIDPVEGHRLGVVEELERPRLTAWYENISNERWRDELATLAREAFYCEQCGVYVPSGIDNLGRWECEEHFELSGQTPGDRVFFRVRADHRPPEVSRWTDPQWATFLVPKTYIRLFPGDTRPLEEALLPAGRVRREGADGQDRGVLQESVRIMRYDARTKEQYTNVQHTYPPDYKNRREELAMALTSHFTLEYPYASPISQNPLVTPKVY